MHSLVKEIWMCVCVGVCGDAALSTLQASTAAKGLQGCVSSFPSHPVHPRVPGWERVHDGPDGVYEPHPVYHTRGLLSDFCFHCHQCCRFGFKDDQTNDNYLYWFFFFFLILFQETSLPRVFKLFRALGLRHLVVVDKDNRVRNERCENTLSFCSPPFFQINSIKLPQKYSLPISDIFIFCGFTVFPKIIL